MTITCTPKAATATAGAITLAGTVSNVGPDGTIHITVPGNGVVVTIAGEYTLAVSLAGVGGGDISVGGSPSAVTVVAAGRSEYRTRAMSATVYPEVFTMSKNPFFDVPIRSSSPKADMQIGSSGFRPYLRGLST